jgi:hypothetical protein
MSCPTIQQLFARYPTDKATVHSYGVIYEGLLAPYRHKTRAVLEIGIGTGPGLGGSLAVWRDYFPLAQVVGIDKDRAAWPPAGVADLTRLSFVRLDQNDSQAMEAFAQQHLRHFDVIIDDGSHLAHAQELTRMCLWKTLRRGGLMVIEDLQDDAAIDRMRSWRAEIYDLRSVQGRYDDVLAVFRKVSRPAVWLGSRKASTPYGSPHAREMRR